MLNKEGTLWDTMGPWLIGAAVLVLMLIIYILFSESGQQLIQNLKDMLRFGR